MRCRLLHVVAVFIFALALTPAAHGQSQITTGVIQGTVSDPNGAVVPGATVEVVNLETNLTRNVTTDDDGRFSFLQLPSGRYSLTVTKEGFAKLIQAEFPLTVGQTISLDLDMKVTGVEGEVTITTIPTVDTVKTRVEHDHQRAGRQQPPRPRPQVRGPADADAERLHRPGAGRRRDQLRRPARRLQQRQPRRRRLQQRLLRRAGRRPARRDRHSARRRQGVSGRRHGRDAPSSAARRGASSTSSPRAGTNEFHGSLFHFQRLEALTANTSDGKSLTDFHREQFGANVGGPIKRDKAFFFVSFEQISENLTRANLSEQVGDTPCPVQTPTILANEALINGNTDCQRLALLNFFRTTRDQEEGLPIQRPISNSAILGKLDWDLTLQQPAHALAQLRLLEEHQPDVRRGDLRQLGQRHRRPVEDQRLQRQPLLAHSRRPRSTSSTSPTRARTARARPSSRTSRPTRRWGSATTFRFGNPFFLAAQRRRDFLAHAGQGQLLDRHGPPHGQVRRRVGAQPQLAGLPRLLPGPLHLRQRDGLPALRLARRARAASGPERRRLLGRQLRDVSRPPARRAATLTGGPLLLYLQGAAPDGPATDAAGASDITNEDIALFAQDKWQIQPQLYPQLRPALGGADFPRAGRAPRRRRPTACSSSDPRFPSDGTLHDQKKMFQPRVGFAWDITGNGKSVLRGSYGIYNARQNMLTQVGSITTNGVQQQTIFLNSPIISFGVPGPVWPGVVTPPRAPARPAASPTRSRASRACASSAATTPTRASTRPTSPSSRSWPRTCRSTSTSPTRRAST